MANFQVHRLPQDQYIDNVRWLPQLSPFHRHLVLSTFSSGAGASNLQLLTLDATDTPPSLTQLHTLPIPSRATSLQTRQPNTHSPPLITFSTFSGSLHIYTADTISTSSLGLLASVGPDKGFHIGPVTDVDTKEDGLECVSVGEDGRVNLVNVGNGSCGYRKVYDSHGLISYSTVKWASPVEFVTGGLGFGLHWWDNRRPGGPVAQFKSNWTGRSTSGIVHSIDIHPSRKHTCLAGGSSGSVFAWDLRWQQEPIILAGAGISGVPANSPCESDIWEVQYDNYSHSAKDGKISSSRVLPAMICSEDGILAVVEQGEEPIEILAEPCAINSFDIDRQNPADVVCSLEWESVAILTRP